MILTPKELEYLSAWAREEWEPECYGLPAHRLQLARRVAGGRLVEFIKAWTESEGKKDQEILSASTCALPTWPWSTEDEFLTRLAEVNRWRAQRQALEKTPGAPAK